MTNAAKFRQQIETHLARVYPESYAEISERILNCIHQYHDLPIQSNQPLWNEADVLLITYGDSIIHEEHAPLNMLLQFLRKNAPDTFSCVHILPFFPFSSDDGFSVIDYRVVNPVLGDWLDVNRLSEHYKLMFDLVINHVSRESLWFYDFVAERPPACDYFIELPETTDVSLVTRPRNSPLLVPVNTHRGTRHLWATFSEDQIDVNFANPDVLLEYIDILLHYVVNGARLIRLDAIAFLWKELGTTCIHLQQTHEVVKLMRDILEYVCPDCILLTETNVPHHENISYFGDGDEAHMVYQFSLPPLVLHALNRGTARYLTEWASQLPELPEHCTYLNFTASHDGIGLRALEGIIPPHEQESLIDSMHQFGGFVSMKANANGEDTPYEINISLFDALQGTRRGTDQWQVARFICSQAIMLSMPGIPAFYIHSMLATPNDLRGVELTGRTRSINRKKWDYDEIGQLLESPNTPNHEVFNELKRLIEIRKSQPGFHPDCDMEVLDVSPGLFSIIRKSRNVEDTSSGSSSQVLAIFNVTNAPQFITIKDRPDLSDQAHWYDLVSGNTIEGILPAIQLQPYQFIWLIEKY